MSQLGSIFEPDSGAPRSRDLRAEVTVPAWACGFDPGYSVAVAPELPALGGYARRVAGPDGEDSVHLRLPAGFPDGGTLRLRGQGEQPGQGGRAGDLLLTVRIDAAQTTPPAGLAWSSGQVLASRPPAPAGLVVIVVLVFAAGAAVMVLL